MAQEVIPEYIYVKVDGTWTANPDEIGDVVAFLYRDAGKAFSAITQHHKMMVEAMCKLEEIEKKCDGQKKKKKRK